MIGVSIRIVRNFGILNKIFIAPTRVDQWITGPGDVILIHMAIKIKGISIKGRSNNIKEILTHLGIGRCCYVIRVNQFLMILKDLDTPKKFF